jgi:nitroreductase
MQKPAKTKTPIHSIIAQRWSPRVFSNQAVATMVLEAVDRGLFSHQMTGFDSDKAAEVFSIPEGYKAVSVTAFGYYGNPDDIPGDIAKLEANERSRNELREMAFRGTFGNRFHE